MLVEAVIVATNRIFYDVATKFFMENQPPVLDLAPD